MTTQLSLFDPVPRPRPLVPRNPHVAAQDVHRLTGQNAVILARLRSGPATNVELAELSLKYTSRISDLRAAGYVIECERMSGGLRLYTLEATRANQT